MLAGRDSAARVNTSFFRPVWLPTSVRTLHRGSADWPLLPEAIVTSGCRVVARDCAQLHQAASAYDAREIMIVLHSRWINCFSTLAYMMELHTK